MLWLVLYLPRLAREVFPSLPSPGAIVSHERIVAVDEAAASAGVTPGLRIAEARALLPDLLVQQRAVEREQAALNRLACWAGSFTSEVCLAPPQTLLLEVAGSLRLFGGAETLFRRVVAGCSEQGFVPQAALAPTPLAAHWLACAGDDRFCFDIGELAGRLGSLPVEVLALSAEKQTCLTAIGVRTLADLLHLPPAGLTRRLGVGLSADLARALGQLPDPRTRFVFPENFVERLELPMRADSAAALAFAGRRLIMALSGWLAARGSGVSRCIFEFEHAGGSRRRPATCLTLAFTGTTRDGERMARILNERLQRFDLPAPVEMIGLRADSPEALPGHTANLFGERSERTADESVATLVERLQARLGDGSVHALSAAPEHRPEKASQRVAASLAAGGKPLSHLLANPAMAGSLRGPRPVWLLSKPRSLIERSGQPQCGGPLRLLAGPERIESGWWDEAEPEALGDVRRDYFIALSIRAEWLWIFRSRIGWFLHGLFS
jgi:protein ImuB